MTSRPPRTWAQDIDDSIDSAESFVFVISGSSLGSQYALEELRHAGKRGKRNVPVGCDGADPDPPLPRPTVPSTSSTSPPAPARRSSPTRASC
jgi:hypothetical protein